MTQKELLYMEDAISHEQALIAILEESMTKCSEDISDYFQNEVIKHQETCNILMNKLKEKANG